MSVTTETYYDAEQKIWSGPKEEHKFGPNVTLGEVILDVLRRNPEKIMQISDTTGEQKTAAELLRDSDLIAQFLINQGLQPGDVVGLCARNTINVTAITIAALLCGTPHNAAFPGFDKENLMVVFKITTPKIIFCDVANYETLKEAVKELELNAKIVTINGELTDVESVAEILKDDGKYTGNIRYPCFDLKGSDTAFILCSSGTTGGPKGITCSHSTLLEYPVFNNVTHNDTIFGFSTLFWISGTSNLLASLLNGATRIITEESFTPAYFYFLVEKNKLTQVFIPTFLIAALTENPDKSKSLKCVKTILAGGSKIHKSISEKFVALLNDETKFLIGYGLTESSTILSQTSIGTTKPIRYDCEGKLRSNMKVRIIDEVTGEALGPNQMGLLHVRLPIKWAGYYRNEEATKKVYSDGWLNTNDMAYFDSDGFLFICGRNSEIFKTKGFFIFPNKLENLILQLPGVEEVCVFPKPDLVKENLPACAIVRSRDEAGLKLTEDGVLKHVEKHAMDMYQLTGGVYFLDKLPKTASGKVQQRNVYNLCKDLKNGD